MKILITGSTGFVGKHLVQCLEKSGHELVHLVRGKKGFDQEFVWDFKSSIPDNMPLCQIVIHLAACVDFNKNLNIEQYMVNTVSTAILTKYCHDSKAGLIFSSTTGVHGNSGMYSEDSKLKPANSYSLSKLLAEQIISAFNGHGFILRIGGIYGVEGPSHLGINNALKKALCFGESPLLSGLGAGKRNYISVIDVVRWINYCVTQLQYNKITKINTLYLGGPEILTIRKYLELICEIFIPDKKIRIKDGPDGYDAIVDTSTPPFEMITFRNYLEKIKRELHTIKDKNYE